MSWLRLLRSRRVGVTTFWRLMADHGDAQTALQALPDIARAAGVPRYCPCSEADALAELRAARAAGLGLLFRGERGYPPDLADLPDAPPILFVAGDPACLARPMVALVGARNASSLGLRMARRLAGELGEAGFVVVSGLARGIDAAAHDAALATGTVAVMAGGVDVVYPAENAALAEAILAQGGARVGEQPPGLQPMARHFPTRNRIVSGLSRAVVVVEAAEKSGSLITARTALDQGREVLAVPGHPVDARAGGCNLLIRDGAKLVRHAGDVIEAMPPAGVQAVRDLRAPVPGVQAPRPARAAAAPGRPGAADRAAPLSAGTSGPPAGAGARLPSVAPAACDIPAGAAQTRSLRETAALHAQILDRLGPSPMSEDQLIRDVGAPAGRVSPALTDLELDGRIRRQPGGLLSLAPPD